MEGIAGSTGFAWGAALGQAANAAEATQVARQWAEYARKLETRLEEANGQLAKANEELASTTKELIRTQADVKGLVAQRDALVDIVNAKGGDAILSETDKVFVKGSRKGQRKTKLRLLFESVFDEHIRAWMGKWGITEDDMASRY